MRSTPRPPVACFTASWKSGLRVCICHKTACLTVSQRQAQAIVPDTHRFADPTGARTARFSRHRREGISYPLAKEAFQDPHKEVVGWENFLGMTIGQAVVWASQNIDPKEVHPELTTSEPYVMGSHATCSGAWASGPEDYAPAEYQWGYNRMMTVDGLFGAGDTIGGTAHKFSSGSFTEGRIAAKAAVKYVMEKGRHQPQVSDKEYRDLEKEIYQPLENYRVGRNEIVAGTVSPSHPLPIHGLQRLEKIMDEYVGGIGTMYMTNGKLLERGLELLAMLKEDMSSMGAEDLHQLQRTWELHHRLIASEAVTRHTLFREETRWPGYYYRGDHMKLDDEKRHCFTLSRYDRKSGEWQWRRRRSTTSSTDADSGEKDRDLRQRRSKPAGLRPARLNTSAVASAVRLSPTQGGEPATFS